MAHRAGSWRPHTLQLQLLGCQTPLLSFRGRWLVARRLAGFGLLSLLAVAATMTLQSALSTCACPRVSGSQFLRAADVPSTPQPEPQDPQIEFSVPGLLLPLSKARELSLPRQPAEQQRQQSEHGQRAAAPASFARHVEEDMQNSSGSRADPVFARLDAWSVEQPPVEFIIAVTSSCCTAVAQQRREAIRRTWALLAVQHAPRTAVRFFLAQPPAASRVAFIQSGTYALLQHELRKHSDMVMLRGEDTYANLPNKTVNILRYVTRLPVGWTHLLKTDDDCYVRMQHIIRGVQNPETGRVWHNKLYMGYMENRYGFRPIRDPASKWYMSHEQLPDSLVPRGKPYLANWAYVLSRDVVEDLVELLAGFAFQPETQPAWLSALHWEDVMVGLLADRIVDVPLTNNAFKAAWRGCTNDTAVKHLDVESPALMDGLAAQDASGLWSVKSVQCSTGAYKPGDYHGWLAWRRGLPDVARV